MSDKEKLEALRKTLKPVIDWYKKVLDDGEPDGSYLYDTTCEIFDNQLSRGDYQRIIETLL